MKAYTFYAVEMNLTVLLEFSSMFTVCIFYYCDLLAHLNGNA